MPTCLVEQYAFYFELLCSRRIVWDTFEHDPPPCVREGAARPPPQHNFYDILVISGEVADEDVVQLAIAAMERGSKTVRNTERNLDINRRFSPAHMNGKVSASARPDLLTVLTEAKELTVEDLLV